MCGQEVPSKVDIEERIVFFSSKRMKQEAANTFPATNNARANVFMIMLVFFCVGCLYPYILSSCTKLYPYILSSCTVHKEDAGTHS